MLNNENDVRADMTLEERIEFEEQDRIEKEEVNELLKELNESCRGLFNQDEILRVEALYEDDPYFDEFSTEAWKVTETVRKTLIRFKTFFKKIFGYINNYTVLRVKVCISAAEKWSETLNTETTEKIDELKKKYSEDSDKTITVEQAKVFLESAAKYYKAASGQVAKVKGLTASETQDADDVSSDKLLSVFSEVEEVKLYRDKWKEISDTFPTEEDKKAASTNGETPENGKWFDKSSIDNLIRAMKNVIGQLQNLKRLQMDCEAIVTDLEKDKSSGEDDKTINLLNKNKIDFLRKFSNDVLTNSMRNICRCCLLSAKQCDKFNKKTEDNSKTEQ